MGSSSVFIEFRWTVFDFVDKFVDKLGDKLGDKFVDKFGQNIVVFIFFSLNQLILDII